MNHFPDFDVQGITPVRRTNGNNNGNGMSASQINGTMREALTQNENSGRKKHSSDEPIDVVNSATASNADIERAMTRMLYQELQWNVPFPRVLPTPVIYEPDGVQEVSSFPKRTMCNADVSAMASGILEEVPVTYFALQPEEIVDMCELVKENERDLERRQRQRELDGLSRLVNIAPTDKNRGLEEVDFKLVDIDFDDAPLTHRDLPSLSLLQRPLYTEIGLIPKEVRHAARQSRLLGTQDEGASGMVEPQESASDRIPQTDEDWTQEVKTGFRRAARVDSAFKSFLKSIAVTKLGLVGVSEEEQARLARGLLRVMAGFTPFKAGAQVAFNIRKARLWVEVCTFVKQWNEGSLSDGMMRTRAAEIISSTEFPDEKASEGIVAWFDQYVACLRSFSSEANKKDRSDSLKLEERDLSIPDAAPSELAHIFRPGSAKSNSDPALHHPESESHQHVFPVEVLPVFPSNFKRAKEAPDMMEDNFDAHGSFAADARSMHHLILRGLKPSHLDDSKRGTPRLLIGDSTLLESNDDVVPEDMGMNVFNTSQQRVFTNYLRNPNSTMSYVLHIKDDVVTYDRIGTTAEYDRSIKHMAPRRNKWVAQWRTDQEASLGRVPGERYELPEMRVVGASSVASEHDMKEEMEEDDLLLQETSSQKNTPNQDADVTQRAHSEETNSRKRDRDDEDEGEEGSGGVEETLVVAEGTILGS